MLLLWDLVTMFGVELMGHLQHPEISKTSRYQKYADLCNICGYPLRASFF